MKFVVIVSIISTVLISNYVGVSNNIHSIVYGLEIYFILTLLYNIDKRLSIGDFIVLMASTMYLLVPALMFDLDVQATMPPNLFGYDILAIEPEIYFKFGIWSIMLFHFSFLTIKSFTTRKKVLDAIEALQSNYDVEKVIKIFLIIASISLLLKGTVSSLNLVFFLGIKLSNLIIVLSLFLKEPRKERRYLFIVILLLFINLLFQNKHFFSHLKNFC